MSVEPPEDSGDIRLCAAKLKVLADRTRLAVMLRLLEEPSHVGPLQDQLGIEQSLLSHHLKVLRDAGLVVGVRDGKAVLYSVSPEVTVDETARIIELGCCRLSFPSDSGSSGSCG